MPALIHCLCLVRQPPRSGPEPSHSRGFLITHNDAPQSVGLTWTSDRSVAETSTITSVEFEPTISAGERPHTYALTAWQLGSALCTVRTFNSSHCASLGALYGR
jgi:hypothetical protein